MSQSFIKVAEFEMERSDTSIERLQEVEVPKLNQDKSFDNIFPYKNKSNFKDSVVSVDSRF